MAQKTSINIKPCNTGCSEAHNRRTAEYLANIVKGNLYIRTDLMAKNEVWVAPDFGDTSLTDRYNQIAAMVKEKTGRAMQTKDRERVNKKTGKVTVVRGSTPLKEGVVVIKEDTSMEQLQRFCEVCKERWGITALQVFIHRDEGHYENPQDIATWKPNLHAHIVWDWMNHDTGKSCKLDEKAKAEKEAALSAKEEAENERDSIENENKAKVARNVELDNEIAEKEKQRDDIRRGKVDSILDSVGSLVGVGKSAAVEKENVRLAAENERMKKAFPDAVKREVEKRTKVLVEERQKAENERDKALVQNRTLTIERDKAVTQLNRQKADEQQRVENAVKLANAEKDKIIRVWQNAWKTNREVLNILADMLYAASEIFKCAIDAIIHYGTEKYKSIFGNDEAADIKSVMQDYGKSVKQQQAIGSWLCDYAESRQPFDETKHRQTYKEVADVANGAYDWKIEHKQENNIKM